MLTALQHNGLQLRLCPVFYMKRPCLVKLPQNDTYSTVWCKMNPVC